MLDSTGDSLPRKVNCALCPRGVSLGYYKPQYGHDGYPVDLGPYIHDDKLQLKLQLGKGGLLLIFKHRIKLEEIYFELENYQFHYDTSGYSFGRPLFPSFGIGDDKVIWVCSSCASLLGNDLFKIHMFLSGRLDYHYVSIQNVLKAKRKIYKEIKAAKAS